MNPIVSRDGEKPAETDKTAANKDAAAHIENERLIGLIEHGLGVPAVDDSLTGRIRTMIATAIGEQYHGLYCIDLHDNRFIRFIERIPSTASLVGESGNCTEAIRTFAERSVEKQDQEAFREFADISALKGVLRHRELVSFEFRHKDAGWMRGKFIVARRDDGGEAADVVFAAIDINAEKALEKAHSEALYESHHDPLTGVFNRKAFKIDSISGSLDDVPVGFAIIDVDHFKEINDEFGHKTGDKVIIVVANALASAFRKTDRLYRIGGDEFVVVLPNATSSVWDAVCSKLEKVHADLVSILPSGADLTLSAGICFGPAGIDEWMYPLADKALFDTKRNGRAGCTLIHRDGTVSKTWRVGNASVRPLSELEDTGLIEKENDYELILAAQSGIFVSSFYINIAANQISPLKQTSAAAAVYAQGLGAQKSLDAFNERLIDTAYRKKIAEFFDLSTLSRRMGSENSIDCDFLSATEQGWCRASWIPVKRDAERLVTHVLFVVASLDATREAEITQEKLTSELMSLHYEAVESVLDSDILAMALFDRKTGEGRAWSRSTNYSMPNEVAYEELRERDAQYMPAEKRDSLSSQLRLEHVVKMVDENKTFTAKSTHLMPGKKLKHIFYHYSAYSRNEDLILLVVEDATRRMEEKRDLALTSDSLSAALKAADLMIWEYDPSEHTAVCFTSENAFGLPKRIEGYPESLMDLDMFEPNEARVFRETVKKIDEGAESARCDVRVHIGGKDHWVACSLYARQDPVLERRFATLFVMDISLRVAAVRSFEERMESLLYADESVIKAGVYNLSRDSVSEVRAKDRILPGEATAHNLDETLEVASRGIPDTAERQRYVDMFSRESLLALFESGKKHTSMECLYRVTPEQTEWAEASAEIVANPANGDVEVIGRIRSISKQKCSNLIVKESLREPFNAFSILLGWGDEYFLFDAMMGAECSHHHDYWGDLEKVLNAVCPEDKRGELLTQVQKERILGELDERHEAKVTIPACYKGRTLRMELSFSLIDAAKGIVFASTKNITDEEILEKLRYESRHDSLTDLYNRQTMFSRCNELLEAHPEQTFIMVKLNIRRFRMFNAFFGEKAGDELLNAIADELRKIGKDHPYCAYGRIESDIFGGFYPKNDLTLGRHIEIVKRRFAEYRSDFRLEPSIGLYVVTDRSLSVESMFSRASSAVKEGGTQICEFVRRYNDELENKLEDEMMIANEMQAALDTNQFKVYLQPKFDLSTGEHAGAEALVRWAHPKHQMMSPGMFIPVFESNGFISSLDRYMWEQVCKLLKKWMNEGRDPKPISVNVSRVSAYSPATVPFILELVSRYDIDPALMELELTESAYTDEPEEIRKRMRILQQAGFKILMDDFGSGYSSLNMLRNLPVDVLKLDIDFISDTENAERGRTIVSSILGMTKKLKLPVIAEGVETEQQAEFLREAGCEYAQGYLLAKPMPVKDYEALG